ncbi:unnamed protein product [Blepharisma stoltei]|uniref:Trichohyalin-like n=1 Tax=Blepharisma stoltei TaxID=1481888 RepID=A0AAU9JCF3_9CILI|nr:unnamed protein product [Blepharisma stoltei]
MVEAYLKKLSSQIGADNKLPKAINEVLETILGKVTRSLKEKVIAISEEKRNLQAMIEKQKEKLKNNDFDAELRKAKVREIKRQKQELENKLNHIENSLQHLNSLEDFEYKKPNLQNKQARQEYYEDLKRKSEENTRKVKEYQAEQRRRKEKIKEHLEEINRQLEEEKERKQLEKEGKNAIFEIEYKQELERMQENKMRRQQELEEMKRREIELAEIKKQKPLYQKMQEKFLQDVEMPELEKRKAELAKKRLLFQPLSKDDLAEHSKWYSQLRKEHNAQTDKEMTQKSIDHQMNQLGVSKNYKLEKSIDEKEKSIQDKLKLVDRKIKYADLVREMFTPSIDKFKQKELELRVEKLKHPVRKEILKSSQEKSFVESYSDGEGKKMWKPRKYPKNPLIPEEKNKKEPVLIDYLGERRKAREDAASKSGTARKHNVDWEEDLNLELTNEQKAERIKAKAEKIEKEARRKELLLNSTTPNNLSTLEKSEDVNQMLISSIRAKLAVLEHVSN